MILECPACHAKYRLSDTAIPPEGKIVRCAKCRHRWFESAPPTRDDADAADDMPPPLDLPAPPPPPAMSVSVAAMPATEVPAAVVSVTAATGIAAAPRTVADAGGDEVIDDDEAHAAVRHDPAAADPAADDRLPARRRRRRWLLGFALLLAAAGGATTWIASARPGLDLAAIGLPPLDLPPLDLTRVPVVGDWLDARLNPPAPPPVPLTLAGNADFRTLSGGRRMLMLTGHVDNPTDRAQPVPPVEAIVVDAARRPVYRWRIAPPVAALSPHARALFDSSAFGVPRDGVTVTLRFMGGA